MKNKKKKNKNSLCGRDKKLRSIRVRTRIGHRKRSEIIVLQREILVGEFLAVNRFPAGSIIVRKITTLAHLQNKNHD